MTANPRTCRSVTSDSARFAIAVAAAAILVGALANPRGVAIVLAAPATAAKPQIEMWGLTPEDELTLDGAAIAVKGSGARTFTGDPAAVDAPVLREVNAGRHEVVVRRPGCLARTIIVVADGVWKRSIVFEPPAKSCALAPPPPRAP